MTTSPASTALPQTSFYSALRRTCSAVLFCLFLTAPNVAFADDWPQWRGPNRSGSAVDFEPPAQWPQALTLRYKVEVGQADSSPVVADGKVVVFSRVEGPEDTRESLSAFNLDTGELLWRSGYEMPFKAITIVQEHASGPFSTPLIEGGRVFTFGILGVMTAWSLEDGKQLWQRRFDDQFKIPRPFYGASQSPLIAEGKLVQHIGGPMDGALAAFNPETGEDLWRYKTDGPAYGSGIAAELGGKKQIVTFTQRTLSGVALDSGALLWSVPYQVNFDATHLTPTLVDGKIVIGAEKTPIRAYEPKVSSSGEWTVDIAWENQDVWLSYSSPVFLDGRLFAFASQKKGQLTELSPTTGETLWTGEPRSGDVGWLVGAANAVLLITDAGELSVFKLEEKGLTKVANYQIADSTVWAHPALIEQGLLIKDQGHLALWSIVPE